MKTVRAYVKADDAYLAASVLEGSGLSPNIRDGHTIGVDWFYSQAIGGVKLEVPDSEYERAVELLGLPAVSETIFTCPCCGSTNVKPRQLSLLNALSLLFFWVAVPVVSRRADCIDCKAVLKMKETSEGLELY
ncbi:hypothetical protein VDG1235_3562 [Verrucomicrobiia bacterium DG1235]|nr:hypothetical protein VDG1235_3562 [Verrucomicrobiae bacterium DG1235]